MKSVGKLAVSLLAMSLFASPVMACLLTDSALTDEERECCRQMAGNCYQMPTHSCCQATLRDSGPYLGKLALAVSAPAQNALAVMSPHKAFGLPNSASEFVAGSDAHAPPASPPAKTSILRI